MNSDCKWSNLTKSALTIGMPVKADEILTRTEQILTSEFADKSKFVASQNSAVTQK